MRAQAKIINGAIDHPDTRAGLEKKVCDLIDLIKDGNHVSGTIKAIWLGPYESSGSMWLTCVVEWCEHT